MYLGADNYLGPTAYLGSSGDDVEPEGAGTLVVWNGLTLSGTAGRHTFRVLDGWESLPSLRHQQIPRAAHHGAFDTPVRAGYRTVLVAGKVVADPERDMLLAELQAAFRVEDAPRLLTVRHAGRTLTAAARVRGFSFTPVSWGASAYSWSVEFVCADPFRYGPQQMEYTTLPELIGGLEFDLFTDGSGDTGFLEFGEQGSLGRVTLHNTGNADASPMFEVRGPAPLGFTIKHVETGRRIVSTTVVPSGSSLVLNTANGMSALDGVDRSGQLTVREWPSIPPGESATFAFTAPTFSSASLVASVRPTYW